MLVQIYSYSIKYRTNFPISKPNFVFDCRGVKNPGRIDNLKNLTGLDIAVIKFLDCDDSARKFLEALRVIVIDSFHIIMDKKYGDTVSIGFCCTGGRHRSVYFSEAMAKELKVFKGVQVRVSHLDMDNDYI